MTNEHYTNRNIALGVCNRNRGRNDHSIMAFHGGQRMKNLIAVVLLVACTTGCTPSPATVFSIPDRAGLGAFLAFEIVGNAGNVAPPAPDGDSAPAGSVCDECGGKGKVGDGTVMLTCNVCNGTGKKPGSVEEEMQQLSDAIDNVPDDWNEATVRDLGDKLADVLEAQEEAKDITELGGTSWTIEEKRSRNASDAEIREHLVTVHGIDPDSANKMDREELLSLHNLLHNTEIRTSAPTADCPSGNCPTSRGSNSSCPSGNCPTSNSSSTRSRGLFGRLR